MWSQLASGALKVASRAKGLFGKGAAVTTKAATKKGVGASRVSRKLERAVQKGATQGYEGATVYDAATGGFRNVAGVGAAKFQETWGKILAAGTRKFPKDPAAAKAWAFEKFRVWGEKNPEAMKQLMHSPGFAAKFMAKHPLWGSLLLGQAGMAPWFLMPGLGGGEMGAEGTEEEQLMAMLQGGGPPTLGGSGEGNPFESLMGEVRRSAGETSGDLAYTQGALKAKGYMDAAKVNENTSSHRADISELIRGYEDLLSDISYREPSTLAEAYARRGIVSRDVDNKVDFGRLLDG